MPELWDGKVPIIRRSLNEGFLGNPEPVREGCIERDLSVDPELMGDSPAAMQVKPIETWDDEWKAQNEAQSSLYHRFLREPFPLLDQNGAGYCWSYSTGHAIMFDRLKQNLPYVRLNPHATAAIIKGGRDEGGWCGLSMKFGREHGYAVEGNGPGEWPLHSRNMKYDTPELRAAMALHKAEEDWYDLGKREYDQELAKSQLGTCMFECEPAPVDYNRFSHSMCAVWMVKIDGRWSLMIMNSWKNWGYRGLGILFDMWPNNAVALRASTPSAR